MPYLYPVGPLSPAASSPSSSSADVNGRRENKLTSDSRLFGEERIEGRNSAAKGGGGKRQRKEYSRHFLVELADRIITMSSAQEILAFAERFSLYFTITLFAVGLLGNTVNLLVFTTLKLFRANQCVFYLTVETSVNICQLSVLFVMYILTLIYGHDPSNVVLVWCKLKNILPQFFRLIATTMVCLAAFDQYLATNHRFHFRQLSTLTLAHRLTIGFICLWLLHSIPYAIFFVIVPSTGCINSSLELIRYYSFFYYPLLHGLFPIFMSGLLSLLAYRNVRHLIRRQIPVVRRRLDRQLTAMVFVRVIVFILLLLPYTIYRIYALNVTISRADEHRYAIDRLIFAIVTSIANLNYAVGETFRQGMLSKLLLSDKFLRVSRLIGTVSSASEVFLHEEMLAIVAVLLPSRSERYSTVTRIIERDEFGSRMKSIHEEIDARGPMNFALLENTSWVIERWSGCKESHVSK